MSDSDTALPSTPPAPPPSVAKIVARAIKKADSSYFFENYDKQAKAVLAALKAEGWAVTRCEADMAIFKAVADAMHTGRMKPEEHVKDIYGRVLDKLKA